MKRGLIGLTLFGCFASPAGAGTAEARMIVNSFIESYLAERGDAAKALAPDSMLYVDGVDGSESLTVERLPLRAAKCRASEVGQGKVVEILGKPVVVVSTTWTCANGVRLNADFTVRNGWIAAVELYPNG